MYLLVRRWSAPADAIDRPRAAIGNVFIGVKLIIFSGTIRATRMSHVSRTCPEIFLYA